MKVLIGTKNQGKIEGAKRAFSRYFDNVEVVGIPVESGVSEQPVGKDIYLGAKNRVDNLVECAKSEGIDADFYVAIESGITDSLGKWSIINLVAVRDKNGYDSWGNSAGFPVPDKYVESIIDKTLGTVMDEIFENNDLRSSVGGISYLTHNIVNRIDLTESAFIMALTQYINKDIWKD